MTITPEFRGSNDYYLYALHQETGKRVPLCRVACPKLHFTSNRLTPHLSLHLSHRQSALEIQQFWSRVLLPRNHSRSRVAQAVQGHPCFLDVNICNLGVQVAISSSAVVMATFTASAGALTPLHASLVIITARDDRNVIIQRQRWPSRLEVRN